MSLPIHPPLQYYHHVSSAEYPSVNRDQPLMSYGGVPPHPPPTPHHTTHCTTHCTTHWDTHTTHHTLQHTPHTATHTTHCTLQHTPHTATHTTHCNTHHTLQHTPHTGNTHHKLQHTPHTATHTTHGQHTPHTATHTTHGQHTPHTATHTTHCNTHHTLQHTPHTATHTIHCLSPQTPRLEMLALHLQPLSQPSSKVAPHTPGGGVEWGGAVLHLRAPPPPYRCGVTAGPPLPQLPLPLHVLRPAGDAPLLTANGAQAQCWGIPRCQWQQLPAHLLRLQLLRGSWCGQLSPPLWGRLPGQSRCDWRGRVSFQTGQLYMFNAITMEVM